MLKRTSRDNTDQYLALLEMRNTPRQDVNQSPAHIVFGRNTRSVLPVILKPCVNFNVQKRRNRQRQTKQCFDKHAKPLRPLHVAQRVYFQHPKENGWTRGTVLQRVGPRTYIVKTTTGRIFKRNRVHIRPSKSHSESEHQPTGEPFFPTPTRQPAGACDTLPVSNSVHARDLSSSATTSSSNFSLPQRDRRPPGWMRDYYA